MASAGELFHLPPCSYAGPRGTGTGSVLTHTGGDVVQVDVHHAGAQLLVVCDVGVQERDSKLPVIHHAGQAAPGLAGGLPCEPGPRASASVRSTHTEITMNTVI